MSATRSREMPAADRLRPIVAALDSKELAAAAFEACLDAVLAEPHTPTDEILARHRATGEDLVPLVSAVVAEREQANCPTPAATLRWAMGRVLAGRPRGSLDVTAVRNALVDALNLTVQEFRHRETDAMHYHLAADSSGQRVGGMGGVEQEVPVVTGLLDLC